MRGVLILMHKNIYTHTQRWRKILNITLYSNIPWAAASSCLHFKSQPGMQLLGCRFTQHSLSVGLIKATELLQMAKQRCFSCTWPRSCIAPGLTQNIQKPPLCSSLQSSSKHPKGQNYNLPSTTLPEYPHCKEILPPNQNNCTFQSFQFNTDMTVNNSTHSLGFYVSFYWRTEWKGAFCVLKKIPQKPKQIPLKELKRKGIQAIHPPAEGPLDDNLFYLKNKDIPVFWHSFNLFYEFMVTFLSIPCCSPRNICIIWFSQLKECLRSFKFLYPLLQFSPVLFFYHLRVQKQY